MKKHIKILLILLISATYQLRSQTFPVLSTTQVLPPYSVYLSDYASISSDKLITNLYLQDQNQSGLQVKLKITITGDNGVKLETKPEFMPQPITMYAGMPEQISGIALQQYLEPANLNITGLNVNEFMQSKKLPEGIYTFSVQAVEYRRNKLVSNSGTAVAWLILNDPPIWNLPHNNSTVTATNPQNIFFSWLPLHTGSPNSAFTTEYEFSLYDIIPQTRNPEEAVNTGVPIHQSITMSNSLVYGPAEMPLELGRKYAVRLKAYDTEGRDMFKNEGYSTVLTFTYGQECITPVGINHSDITPHTANVQWTSIPGNTEFTLYYREKNEDGTNPWYEGNTAQTNATITQLKPQFEYQYLVRASCGTIESEPSEIYEFTTSEKTLDTLDCGDNPNIPVIDGSPPLQELLFGDVINVGGFEGIVTQAHGGNGVFSGKCIMRVSNFNILLKSHFDDISVNQSYQVTAGTVVADRGPGIMINLDDLIPAIDSLANIPPDSIVAHIDDFIDVADSLVYEIDPVIVSDSLQIVLEDLQETLNTVVGDTSLTDVQQNEIQNLIDHIESLLNQTIEGADNPTFVMFKEFPEQTYGFDEPDSSLTTLYQYYQPPNNVGGTDQFIRWKSIKVGGTDKVFAQLDSTNTTIKFYDEANNPLTPLGESNDTLKVLQLTSGTAETTSIIRAEININDTTTQVVGMLNLITYPEKITKLVVVHVNGNALPGNMSSTEFKDQLDKIYGVAGVKWNLLPEININFDYAIADQTATFNAWPIGGSPYTLDMNSLIAQIATSSNYDESNYYLFLLNNSEISGQMGIMPFSQQYAFVFADKFNQDGRFIKTSAHELAHGIFNLEHQYKFHAGIDTFATPNLMTYHPTATNLNKYQWDRVQNPLDRGYHDAEDEMFLAWEKLENVAVSINEIPPAPENNILPTLSFISKAGIIITLPQTAKDFTFFTNGTLQGFKLGEDRYIAAKNTSTDKFCGYSKDFTMKMGGLYTDNISKNIDYTNAKVFYTKIDNNTEDCSSKYKLYSSNYLGENILSDIKFYENINFKNINEVVKDYGNEVQDPYYVIPDIFNCLSSNYLKTIYKYINYKHPSFNANPEKHLDKLFTIFEDFKDVYIKGLDEGATSNEDKYYYLDISSENSITELLSTLNLYITEHPTEYKTEDLTLILQNKSPLLFPALDSFQDEHLGFLNCFTEGGNPIEGDYYLPSCLWLGSNLPQAVYYTPADMPFACGYTDGLINGTYGVATFIVDIAKVGASFSVMSAACDNTGLEIFKDYLKVANLLTQIGNNINADIETIPYYEHTIWPVLNNSLEKMEGFLEDEELSAGEHSVLREAVQTPIIVPMANDYKSKVDNLANDYCAKGKDIRENTIESLKAIEEITNPENIDMEVVYAMVKQIALETYNSMDGLSDVDRYKQGRIMGEVVFLIATTVGTGGSSAIGTNLAKFTQKLNSLGIKLKNVIKFALAEKRMPSSRHYDVVGKYVRRLNDNKAIAEILENGNIRIIPEYAITTATVEEGAHIIKYTFKNVGIQLADGTVALKNLAIYEKNAEAFVYLAEVGGSWLSTLQMRNLTQNWAILYRQGLSSNNQLSKFNKACTASWKNATLGKENIFYGRNGGILNNQSAHPTVSAGKGLDIHPELASKLPENTQWPNIANCAEYDAVNQALWEGASWSEIQIHTIDIRPNGTMTDVMQCSECLDVFDGMRVTSQ